MYSLARRYTRPSSPFCALADAASRALFAACPPCSLALSAAAFTPSAASSARPFASSSMKARRNRLYSPPAACLTAPTSTRLAAASLPCRAAYRAACSASRCSSSLTFSSPAAAASLLALLAAASAAFAAPAVSTPSRASRADRSASARPLASPLVLS